MSHHYLGTTASGEVVSRKSTNPGFTHAAVAPGWTAASGRLPNFGTSADGAARNFSTSRRGECEVVAVRKVDAAEYRKATGK